MPPAPRRWLAAFGRFCWEFLLGDTPELFVGVVVAVGAVALLAHAGAEPRGLWRALTVGALPVLVVVVLAASLRRARRSARSAEGSEPS
ncbi:MAG TPA: hypothetical protein VN768_05395 [Acidimicrobiales bacterium]|nr:hypothetical protein [Acidimicrobiales bacterium]